MNCYLHVHQLGHCPSVLTTLHGSTHEEKNTSIHQAAIRLRFHQEEISKVLLPFAGVLTIVREKKHVPIFLDFFQVLYDI